METYKKLTPFDIIQKPIPQYEMFVNNIISATVNEKTFTELNVLIKAMNFNINDIYHSCIIEGAALKQSARRGIMNIGIGYIPKLPYLKKEEIVKLLKKRFNNKAKVINEKDDITTFLIHKQDFYRLDIEETLRIFFNTNYIKDIYYKLEPTTLVYTIFHIMNSKEK